MFKREIKRLRSTALFAILLAMMLLYVPCAIAQETAFQEDFPAIDLAAKSVLMLEVYDRNNTLAATGSGFVAFNNQTVITNYHVMEGAYSIKAYSDEGYYYMINSVIAADKGKDIAILGFESPSILQPLPLAENAELLRGQPVVAIGSPIGIKNTVSTGNISTILSDGANTLIQFTAPISHGSSGGALFDAKGQVIGITFASLEEGQNLNYAVDIDDAILLYANRSGIQRSFAEYFTGLISTPTNTPRPTATPKPSPTPAPMQPSKISNLTAKQVGPNSVELQWKENSKGLFTYKVFLYINDALFTWTPETTTSTTYVCKNLAPGYEYTFSIGTMEHDDFASTVKLKVLEADRFSTRNFKAKSLAIYYCTAGEYFWDAKRTKTTTFKMEDLKKVGVTRDYKLVLAYGMSKADKDSTMDELCIITTPKKNLIIYSSTREFIKEGYSNFVSASNMNAMLLDCAKYDERGTYTIKLYFNGQLAAKTSFKVK